jgi:hypothetical protein
MPGFLKKKRTWIGLLLIVLLVALALRPPAADSLGAASQ